jgi:hypothetical protein
MATGTLENPGPRRLSVVAVVALICLLSGCSLLTPQPQGQIVVQEVSGPLVKKLAEPNAGLPGRKVTVENAEDHSVIAEKTTGASGLLTFDVPAGRYLVVGVSDEPESVTVEAGQATNLRVVQH